MALDVAALNPPELVVLLIGIAGLVPLVVYRSGLEWWVVVPYTFLLTGAILTNVEHLILPTVLNFLEHSIGNLGAGVTMAIAAYVGRNRLNGDQRSTEDA